MAGDIAAMSRLAPEVKQLLLIGGPMIAVNVFSYAVRLISLMFVGRLSDAGLALSMCSLATSIANVLGISVLTGMASTLDTLCGQAYGSKARSKLLGIYLNQSLLVLNAAAVPLSLLFLYAGDILRNVLGQEASIAEGAGRYLVGLIPSLFALATGQSYVRFLVAQGLVSPVLVAGLTTLCIHVPICWLLVHRSGMGFLGAAVAASVSPWINVVVLACYCHGSQRSDLMTRAACSLPSLYDLKPFLALALPSSAMSCLEWWCYEILILLSGLLPNPAMETSTLAVCLSITTILFQVPFGIAAGVSTRVSNELGARNVRSARDAMTVGLCLSLSVSVAIAVALVIARHVAGRLFTDDDDVVAYVANICPLLALSICLDATQTILSGAARGCGLQGYGAMINFSSYYLVGLPVGCIMAFTTPLGGEGLWMAAVCAPFVQVSCLFLLLHRADWEKLANAAAAAASDDDQYSALLGDPPKQALVVTA